MIFQMISTLKNSILNSLIFCGFFYLDSMLFLGIYNRRIYFFIPPISVIPFFLTIVWSDMIQRDLGVHRHYEWWDRRFNLDIYGIIYSVFSSLIYSIIFCRTSIYYPVIGSIFFYNIFRIWWYQCDPFAVMLIGGNIFFKYIETN